MIVWCEILLSNVSFTHTQSNFVYMPSFFWRKRIAKRCQILCIFDLRECYVRSYRAKNKEVAMLLPLLTLQWVLPAAECRPLSLSLNRGRKRALCSSSSSFRHAQSPTSRKAPPLLKGTLSFLVSPHFSRRKEANNLCKMGVFCCCCGCLLVTKTWTYDSVKIGVKSQKSNCFFDQ